MDVVWGSQRPDEAWSCWIGPTHWHTEIVGIRTWWQLLSCVWIESSHIPPDCWSINTQQLLWIVILVFGLSCCVPFALTYRVPFLGYNRSLRPYNATWNKFHWIRVSYRFKSRHNSSFHPWSKQTIPWFRQNTRDANCGVNKREWDTNVINCCYLCNKYLFCLIPTVVTIFWERIYLFSCTSRPQGRYKMLKQFVWHQVLLPCRCHYATPDWWEKASKFNPLFGESCLYIFVYYLPERASIYVRIVYSDFEFIITPTTKSDRFSKRTSRVNPYS